MYETTLSSQANYDILVVYYPRKCFSQHKPTSRRSDSSALIMSVCLLVFLGSVGRSLADRWDTVGLSTTLNLLTRTKYLKGHLTFRRIYASLYIVKSRSGKNPSHLFQNSGHYVANPNHPKSSFAADVPNPGYCLSIYCLHKLASFC